MAVSNGKHSYLVISIDFTCHLTLLIFYTDCNLLITIVILLCYEILSVFYIPVPVYIKCFSVFRTCEQYNKLILPQPTNLKSF